MFYLIYLAKIKAKKAKIRIFIIINIRTKYNRTKILTLFKVEKLITFLSLLNFIKL